MKCTKCGGTGETQTPIWAKDLVRQVKKQETVAEMARELGWGYSTTIKRLEQLELGGLIHSMLEGGRRLWHV